MESAAPKTAPADPDRRGGRHDAKRGWFVLGILTGCFAAFAAFAVPRLTNNAVGDLEFTGWSGPIGSRIARGEVPYVDFVLPIPPGSLELLSGMEKLTGRAALLHELGLIAVMQLGLALLGYALVRPFARRDTAVLVACSSLVILLRGPKECAYDHTAQLLAWASLATGTRALTELGVASRRRWWVATGVLSAFTLAFKQSTALGSMVGWSAALAYLAVVAVAHKDRDRLASLGRDLLGGLGGALVGVLALALLLAAVGSSLGAYWQAVFVDGPSLKGGSYSLGANLVGYLLGAPAYPASLLLTLAAAGVLVRLGRKPDGFYIACSEQSESTTVRTWAFIAVSVAVVFLGATLLLWSSRTSLPPSVLFWADRLRYVPSFGLLVACLAFVAQLARPHSEEASPGSHSRGHALNATLIAALSVSLLHNLSSPEFRPFYDPNPIIPLAFYCLFRAFERAGLPRLRLAVFAASLLALFSPKLDRALAARFPIGRHGHWAGLYVSESAMPIVRAALRVRDLAREDETVLVLPEDVQLSALIGRPRPPIKGAIVFVDQYPSRLLDEDLATLEKDLPKVVVVRPAEREAWIRMFALWNNQSGARKVTERFLDDWLPAHYRRDSTYPTSFANMTLGLEVWVRTSEPR